MTSTTSDVRPGEQSSGADRPHTRQAGVVSPASDRATVDRPSLTGPTDQLPLVDGRLHEILISGGGFDAIYRLTKAWGLLRKCHPPSTTPRLRRDTNSWPVRKPGILPNVE